MTSDDVHRQPVGPWMPYASYRREKLFEKQTKFARYTSAYAALQIIEKKTAWMRNAVLMNDSSEVQNGQECLRESWIDKTAGGQLRKVLEKLEPGSADLVAKEIVSRGHDWQAFQAFHCADSA